jgi:F-box-like
MLQHQPTCVLVQIFSLLKKEDLLQCRSVCWHIRQLLDTTSSAWPIIQHRTKELQELIRSSLQNHSFTYPSLVDILVRVMSEPILEFLGKHVKITNVDGLAVRVVAEDKYCIFVFYLILF